MNKGAGPGRWLVYGGVGLLLVCCMAAAGLAMTAYALQGAGVIPPLVPGWGPTPTAVPTATPAEEETLDPAIAAYLESISPELELLTAAIEAAAPLLSRPDMANDTWRRNALLQADLLQAAYLNLSQIEPPESIAETHTALLNAAGDCGAGANEIQAGLEAYTLPELKQGEVLLARCAEKLEAVRERLPE